LHVCLSLSLPVSLCLSLSLSVTLCLYICLFLYICIHVCIFYLYLSIPTHLFHSSPSLPREHSGRLQGDQIGRKFAHGAIVYFGQFLENYDCSLCTFLGYIFPQLRQCFNSCQKMGWATFWAISCTNSSGHPGRLAKREVPLEGND
jgi:hypothetical protein